jgi:prepilin-type processing-associated H-X9-DG protein
VVAIIAILAALLAPALSSAKESGRKAVCLSNLRQIGVAIHVYADEFNGSIPYGPKAPPFTSPANFYPSTGAPTSLVSLQGGSPVALGLLLQQHLSAQPRVLYCPGSDQKLSADAELANVGRQQAQGSYFYRHGGSTRLFDNPSDGPPQNIRLDDLGNNRNGLPIRALAIDTMFLCPPDLMAYNLRPQTHHRQKFADILFSDGHVESRPNTDARFTVDLREYAQIHDAFNKILTVFERADEGR